MKNADKPINPVLTQNPSFIGLTKREHFAGLAMQGFCSNQEFLKNLNGDPNLVIKACIEIVDELLKQLEENE